MKIVKIIGIQPYFYHLWVILLKSQQHLVPCGLQDDACETDSITDWMVNGKQQYTIVRKCHSKSRDTPEIGTTEVLFEIDEQLTLSLKGIF